MYIRKIRETKFKDDYNIYLVELSMNEEYLVCDKSLLKAEQTITKFCTSDTSKIRPFTHKISNYTSPNDIESWLVIDNLNDESYHNLYVVDVLSEHKPIKIYVIVDNGEFGSTAPVYYALTSEFFKNNGPKINNLDIDATICFKRRILLMKDSNEDIINIEEVLNG